MPGKTLVIYYSRTGNTRGVATTIAQELEADKEELREPSRRRGWLRSLIDALRRRDAEILPIERDFADYDLVVIGSPVWASHMSSPILGFLRRERDRLPAYALFVTEGGSGGHKALEEMEAEVGKPALATLEVTKREIESGHYFEHVRLFAKRVQAGMGSKNDG